MNTPRDETDALLAAMASITPILGVSDECLDQSLAYIGDLFNLSGNSAGWGKRSECFRHFEIQHSE